MSLFIGVSGLFLTQQDALNILNPKCSGVILFKRNFESFKQLKQLCQEIRAVKEDILISTDHEGGRVQRFKSEDFMARSLIKIRS